MSTNPTYWSIQKISINLTVQANWLKASGLDLRDIQHRYYEAASQVAVGNPEVTQVMSVLDGLWPAGFKPINLHYDGNPFANTVLYSTDASTLCVKSAKPKGLKIPASFFQNDSEMSVENQEPQDTGPVSTEETFELIEQPSRTMEKLLQDYQVL